MAALSPAEVTRPIEPCGPAAVRTARKDLARNLRSAVAVDDYEGGRLSPGDGGAQRGDSELLGHPLVQGVARDPVAEQVLDRAAVEFVLEPTPWGAR